MKGLDSILVLLLLLLTLSVSCKTTKEKGLKKETSMCPDDGICTFEIIDNHSLEIKKDHIGALYPVLTEGKTSILKFQYKRNEIPNTQDGQYIEEVYVEIPQKIKNIELSDANLSKLKVLFSRLCFCRGQTGYYKVSKGQLEINKNNDDRYDFKLNFNVLEVPQIITTIEETFKL